MNIRMDEDTVVGLFYIAPTMFACSGHTCRGFSDAGDAMNYAGKVRAFFDQNALGTPVYVVQGPTSTTPLPYEVVSVSCGYPVLARLDAQAVADATQ